MYLTAIIALQIDQWYVDLIIYYNIIFSLLLVNYDLKKSQFLLNKRKILYCILWCHINVILSSYWFLAYWYAALNWIFEKNTLEYFPFFYKNQQKLYTEKSFCC